MPRVIPSSEIAAILQLGDFNQLLGGLEDEHLECKSAPYRLELEREKMKFAKDVSAFANADGGIILIGVQTEEEPNFHGDIIRRVGCFARGLVDCGQYQNVISDWVLPVIRGLRFEWHPSATNGEEGIVSIVIPQEASRERPFLVARVVEKTGRTVGSHVGFFERARDNVSPMKAEQLREMFKGGQRFAELDTRLEHIEEMIGKMVAVQAPQQPALSGETVFSRVQQARRELGYERKPAFSLAAWPLQPVDFPSLFESHEAQVVRLLENPPRLRNGGFDLSTRTLSTIVVAQLRRCLIPGRKLLEVWRDGTLICVVPGDEWHLCWGMRSSAETGLRINNLALTETVYLFCDWALKVYENAVPAPEEFKIRIMLSDMTLNGRPLSLNPYRPSEIWLDDDRHPAPEAAPGVHVEIDIDRLNAEPGVLAYRLLADLYAWFGFNATEMPYANREIQPPKIDPAQIG